MAGPRKLFHLDIIIDSNVLHDMLLLAEGHAFDLKINAINGPSHLNGVGPSGRTSQQSAREVLWPWMLQQQQIVTADAQALAEQHSISKPAVYTLLHKSLKQKL